MVAQVLESNNFGRKDKVVYFLQWKTSIKICQASMGGTWLRMFWAVDLNTHCVGSKKTYFWRELLIFEGLGNNVCKGKELSIEDDSLPRLSREELLSDCCFKVDIMIIWEFIVVNSKKFKLWNQFKIIERTEKKFNLTLGQVLIALS